MKMRILLQTFGWLCFAAGVCVSIYATTRDAKILTIINMSDSNTGEARSADIEKLIKDLDTKYQLAVKNNDSYTMSEILADDFVLVTGRGKAYTKSDLLGEARSLTAVYDRQESSEQTVRIWGDTAVITALLWEKGESGGVVFDKKLWFSDVYKLTPSGWKYVFAQSSIPLPDDQ